MRSGWWSSRCCGPHAGRTTGPWHETRAVLNGVFWCWARVRTGVSCRSATLRTRPTTDVFQQCIRSRQLEQALHVLARHLRKRGKLDLEEAFVDATFASAERGLAVGPTRRGKGTKIAAVASVTVCLSPHLFKALVPQNAASSKECLARAFLTSYRSV